MQTAVRPDARAVDNPPLIWPTDVVIRYIGYGGQWDPTGAPWAPLGPLGGPKGPLGAPVGPLGPWEKPLKAYRPRKFENLPENLLFDIFGSKMGENKNWDSGPGTPTARSGPEFCAGSRF